MKEICTMKTIEMDLLPYHAWKITNNFQTSILFIYFISFQLRKSSLCTNT